MKRRIILSVIVLLSAVYGQAFGVIFSPAEGVIAGQPVAIEIPRGESKESSIIDTACELIYEGKFEAADKVVVENSRLGHLANIIGEYKTIDLQRKSAREAAYSEQLSELEKLQADTDVNDVNDVNDITKILGIVNKVREFADESQREQLLSESFVKQTFQISLNRAAEI